MKKLKLEAFIYQYSLGPISYRVDALDMEHDIMYQAEFYGTEGLSFAMEYATSKYESWTLR